MKKNIIFILNFIVTIQINCADGSLDSTFNPSGTNTGTPGTVITSPAEFGSTGVAEAFSIALESNGKIVAGGFVGSFPQIFAIAVYNTDGSLDTSFNGTGTVTNSFSSAAAGVAVQSDDKIVGVGTRIAVGGGFCIARYNTDGTLDTTFNGTGTVITDFRPFFGVTSSSAANAVVIQPSDQKIVVAGTLTTTSPNQTQFLIARYTTTGSLDTSFNGTGFINIPPSTFGAFTNAQGLAVSLQSDGKIVIAGIVSSGGPTSFALARLNTDGTLDTTFNPGIGAGFNGVEVTPASSFGSNFQSAQATSISIQSDNKIIVAGGILDNLFNESFAIARYNANGTLDTTFNGTGTQVTQAGVTFSQANGVGVQSTGKIVAGGIADDIDGNVVVALTRYNTDGTLDTTFGVNGIVTTPPISFNATFDAEANALVIQSDNKIVISGFSDSTTVPPSSDSFALARYTSAPPPPPPPPPVVCQTNLNQAIVDKYGIQ